MNTVKALLSVFLCFALVFASYGQTLENVNASFDGEKMLITYDLGFTDANQKFKVALYSSHDNYTTPLAFSAGDLGENVMPGKAKRIEWEVKNSLPADFDSDITLKVKASKVRAPVAKLVINPLSKGAYKKGQTVDLQWQGGRPTDKINIELYKDNDLQNKLAENVSNNQSYKWAVPKALKGKGYSIHISTATDQSNSQSFTIKPKMPILLIIAPVVVLGGAIAFLGGSKSPKDPPIVSEDLPGPAKPQ